MLANYGYTDGSGDYFITVDTDKCDSCGLCVTACPEEVFELAPDDFGKIVARVKSEKVNRISYVCRGFKSSCSGLEVNCHTVCKAKAIDHSW